MIMTNVVMISKLALLFIYILLEVLAIQLFHFLLHRIYNVGQRLWMDASFAQFDANVQCFGAQSGVQQLRNVLNIFPYFL